MRSHDLANHPDESECPALISRVVIAMTAPGTRFATLSLLRLKIDVGRPLRLRGRVPATPRSDSHIPPMVHARSPKFPVGRLRGRTSDVDNVLGNQTASASKGIRLDFGGCGPPQSHTSGALENLSGALDPFDSWLSDRLARSAATRAPRFLALCLLLEEVVYACLIAPRPLGLAP